MSLFLLLLVNWASLTVESANSVSKSKSSSFGGGYSQRIGGNTEGMRPNSGVSNWGGINVYGSCLTANSEYRPIASFTMSKSVLYRFISKSPMKFDGNSSESC